ncbi:MAG: Sugar phosphate permease [Chloroflexi bacterium]|nr:MAG: Sugar phosphate permease [Chloroflexota bacterium]
MASTPPLNDHRPWAARLPFFYGWLILPVASLALFISGPGQTYTVSVFVDPIIEDMGWSRTMVSSLYTAGSLTAALGMVMVGKLLDRYGARVMLTAVGILFGFAVMWMSRVGEPVHLYLGFAAIRALGQGSLTLIPTALVALWFIRRRGKATALASLGSVASQATLPPVTHLLISHLGWRHAWVALAFMIWGALLLPVLAFVRRSPESVGLQPDGNAASMRGSGQATVPATHSEVNWSLREAFRAPAFWLLLFAGSSQSLISTALVFHQVSLFASKGLDAGLAAVALTVMAIAVLAGIFIAGILTDKIPNRYVLASAQAIMAMGMLWTFLISEPWEALVYSGIMGVAGGLFITISAVIWPNYFGRKHLGSIRGVATTSSVAFAALGPMPFGLLFDLTGSYTIPILAFLALPAACAIAALLAFPPSKRVAAT